MTTLAALSVLLLAVAFAQQIGTNQAETHPTISIQQCTGSGQCQTQSRSIVLDSNWRWTHAVGRYTNCFTGNLWNETACPDPATCATNCAIDGADYEGTYGIKAGGNSVALKLVTVGQYDTNVGSRVYLMEDEEHYQMFKLKNREFTMDVDVSQLPCGLNGAVYFVEMDADGGMSKFPSNKAGAKYGTGYCDAQCPHDMKWINGEANLLDWTPDPNNKNSGVGKYGTCCNEMDIWEANSMATAYTPHVCSVNGQYRCSGTECGDNGADRYLGVCDKDGCDFNSYRLGNQDFFGEGKTVDTKQKVTVVTQFITADGTDTGDLSEIKRFYVQNGKVIPNSYISYSGNVSSTNSVTDKFCTEIKSFFGDNPAFEKKGGLKAMGESLERGVVLVMSLWDDYYAYMLWLDSSYPTDEPPTKPGVARGPCPTSSGRPQDVESKYPDSTVTYSNIKYGAINSTFSATFNF